MTSAPTTPLRQRMIEDMTIRQFGPKTQHDYVRVVADFARFLGRSPDQAGNGGRKWGRARLLLPQLDGKRRVSTLPRSSGLAGS
jgi:hypothetical protein